MKKLSKRQTIIVNAMLAITLLLVYVINFVPRTTLETYSDDTLSAIYNGNRTQNNVSLMFNVYENTKIVNSIIDVLDEKNVKETFFVGGGWQMTILKRLTE